MTESAPTGSSIRLLTYNVLSLRLSVDAVASVIRSCAPDIVCLQEAPRFLFWRRRIDDLARATGLSVVAGHRRAGAVLVMTKPGIAVLESGETRLAWRIGRHRRGVATALLDVGDHRLAVASVHMSLYADERARHLPLIRAAVERYGAPVVIAGDINEEPDGAVWSDMARVYQDGYVVAPDGEAHTFSAKRPRRRIDAVFADGSLKVVSCGVPDVERVEEASDHRPVLAVLDHGPSSQSRR